jgi:hypothetical protein
MATISFGLTQAIVGLADVFSKHPWPTHNKLCIITRLRLDTALYDPAPQRASGTTGRPRRNGA